MLPPPVATNQAERLDALDAFLHPDGVAIIGLIRGPRHSDESTIRSDNGRRWGKRWFLVHPKGGSIGNIPIYRSVREIGEKIELAVLSVGTRNVIPVMRDCVGAGIKNILIFTAGYSELGDEGAAAEAELREFIAEHGVHVIGPNTNTYSFEPMTPVDTQGGKVALITHSGHQGRILREYGEFGLPLSRWIAAGNEVDFEMADFIAYFARDPETAVIAAYAEGFHNGPALRGAFEAANRADKPVVLIKLGRTEGGRRQASSHTGHLTGADAVFDGLFEQHGVTRVDDLDDLAQVSNAFAKLPRGLVPNIVIYGVSGGSNALAMEVAEQHGIGVPPLDAQTQRSLHEILPAYLSVTNPVDNGATFLQHGSGDDRLRVLQLMAADPAADVLVVVISANLGRDARTLVADIERLRATHSRPVLIVYPSPIADEELLRHIVHLGLPLFRSLRGCMVALRAIKKYEAARRRFRSRRWPELATDECGIDESQRGQGTLSAHAARNLLARHGVPVVEEVLVHDRATAADVAARLGGRVVMKISSPHISHRSDLGLVAVDVPAAESGDMYDALVERAGAVRPDAAITGVEIQRLVPDGVELLVGIVQDATFGYALTLGAGGIYAETLRDVVSRPLPVDRGDIAEMVEKLTVYPILKGARGGPVIETDELVDVIERITNVVIRDGGSSIAEIEVNPLIATAAGIFGVDALVELRHPAPVGAP